MKHQDFVKVFEQTNKNKDLTKKQSKALIKQQLQLTESAFQWHKQKYNNNHKSDKQDIFLKFEARKVKKSMTQKIFKDIFLAFNGDKVKIQNYLMNEGQPLSNDQWKYHTKLLGAYTQNSYTNRWNGLQHVDFVEVYEKLNKDEIETKRALHLSKPAFNYHRGLYNKNNKTKQLDLQIEKIKNKQLGNSIDTKKASEKKLPIDLFKNALKNGINKVTVELNHTLEKENLFFEGDNTNKLQRAKRNMKVFEEIYEYFDGNKEEIKKYLFLDDVLYNYYYFKSNDWFKSQQQPKLLKSNDSIENIRKYNLTFAELIDRLSIIMLKKVFIENNADDYEKEIALIKHDIALELSSNESITKNIVDIMTTSMYIILCNRVIWENESHVRKGENQDFSKLRFTHSLNGVRNELKNFISKSLGERIDLKVDCLADDMNEVGSWNKVLLDLNNNKN